MPSWLTLRERPHLKKALGSAAFDADGVATAEKCIVDGGTVASYILSTYSARKLDMAPTGNAGGVHNVDVEGPQTPLAELRARMGTGLIVTELMGQGVNLTTGDYSRGATGFWVSACVALFAQNEDSSQRFYAQRMSAGGQPHRVLASMADVLSPDRTVGEFDLTGAFRICPG